MKNKKRKKSIRKNDEDSIETEQNFDKQISILDKFLTRSDIPDASLISSSSVDDDINENEKKILNTPSFGESISVSLPSGHTVSVSSASLSFEKLAGYFANIFMHTTHQEIKSSYFFKNKKEVPGYLG